MKQTREGTTGEEREKDSWWSRIAQQRSEIAGIRIMLLGRRENREL